MEIPAISKVVPIRAKQTIDEAFGTILRYNFDYMLGWAPIAYSREDIEGVHQVRVAFRRMRSALVIFRKAIPRHITDPVGVEMKWIAGELGPARDLDVFIDEGLDSMAGKIPLPKGEEGLRAIALKHRDQAYDNLRAMMDGERYKKFVTDFDLWLKERVWFQSEMSADTRIKLGRKIRVYAIKVLDKRVSKVMQTGEHIDQMSEEELHQLRIECKKLRYATEFFIPIFAQKKMAEFTLHLKGLQGLLGTMNDVAVMPTLLGALLKDTEDRETSQFAGALIGWRARQYEEVRNKLHDHWTTFANSVLPWS